MPVVLVTGLTIRSCAQLSIFSWITLLLSLGVGLVFIRSITSSIAILESSFQKIAHGDHSLKVSNLVNDGELGSLARSFDSLARKLELREEALAISEQLFKTTIDTEPDFIKMLDNDCNLLMINRAGLEMIEADSPEQVIGQSLCPLITEPHRDAFTALTNQVFQGSAGMLTFETIGLKGRHNWLETHAVPFRNERGEIVALLGITRNITRRKLVENYREMGREILQILNEVESFQDSNKRIVDVLKTQTGFDAVGMRLQEKIDFPYIAQIGFSSDFLSEENFLIEHSADGGLCLDDGGQISLKCTCGMVISGKIDPSDPLFTAGGSFWTNDLFQLSNIPPDGNTRLRPCNVCMSEGFASMALVPIRDKDKIVGLIQFNDHRTGLLNPQTVEILEGIAAHVGQAMMRKRAEEELQKKDADIEQFLYTVSHDLRTPLVTVKTFIGYLEKDTADGNQEYIDQDIRYIHSAADKMKLMLDELLELSRIGRIETPSVKMLLSEVLSETIDALAGIISERNVEIHLPDKDLALYGERPRVSQIWLNLIDNAIKFSIEGRFPRVDLGVLQESGETIFFVRDNGIGIDPAYCSRIFNIFEKLDPNSHGAGLGLSMIQRIVNNCGGRIWVESEGAEKGSCFFFTLPHVIVSV
jgi:PAS domain S-box-containing protein